MVSPHGMPYLHCAAMLSSLATTNVCQWIYKTNMQLHLQCQSRIMNKMQLCMSHTK